MSDAARLMEMIRTYDHFVRNVVTCAENLTVTMANGATNALLSAMPPSLQNGRDYSITAAGLADGTWFKFRNTATIRLSQPAQASGQRDCIVQPYLPPEFW